MNQGAHASEGWTIYKMAADTPAAEVEDTTAFEPPPIRRRASIVVGGVLIGLAIVWIAALAWAVGAAVPVTGLGPLRIAAWIGLGCGPLALLALLFLLLLRSGRVEASAYSRASAQLRADSAALAGMLALVTQRIDQAREDLSAQAGQLDTLGLQAGERLTAAAATLRGQAEAFGRAASGLDDATALARADLGVLLTDLPNAEAVTRAIAQRLRESGSEADTNARALANMLAELEAHARGASEATGGAAARLAGQLDRIEESAAAADRRIEEAAGTMGRAIDAALAAAAEGIDDTRRAVSDQSAALTAMVAQGHATLGTVGDDAAAALSQRIDELTARIGGLGDGLQAQDAAARNLLGQLEQALAAVERKFEALGDKGAAHTADLAEAIVALADHSETVSRTLGGSSEAADALLGRVTQLREQTEASNTAVCETIPAALARISNHAEQSLQAIINASQRADRLNDSTAMIGEHLTNADSLLEQQRATLDDVGALAGQRLQRLHEQSAELEALLAKTEAEIHSLSEGATGQLIEALLRVRETANQAASHAHDALTAAIPRAAQQLTETATREMTAAIANVGQTEMAAVGAASGQAVEAARLATERLGKHLVTIAETSTAVEARIAENRTQTEAHDEANFARSVTLLIEALNSTAIDVAKLFSNEVSDDLWKSYLKGDRGIFTRRAVRLLDRAEAGAISARYGEDAEFRELVNRYIHDFEALLRRVMATREGLPIATTMLSSDAGKLYVALAQAIERLRR